LNEIAPPGQLKRWAHYVLAKRMDIDTSQLETCRKYGVARVPSDLNLKLGVSDNFFSGKLPLNGLRHPPGADTCGWYLWAGEELSTANDFFKPLHVSHLIDQNAVIARYLGLPPGWRFLVAIDYEEAWFDSSLLEI
jgi:hypothetical protein